MNGKNIARKQEKVKSRTDWARIRAMKDADIDYSDIPEFPDGFWDDAEVIIPPHKVPLSVRLDEDVVKWFRRQGPGYQTRMNAVLRSFMEAKARKSRR